MPETPQERLRRNREADDASTMDIQWLLDVAEAALALNDYRPSVTFGDARGLDLWSDLAERLYGPEKPAYGE